MMNQKQTGSHRVSPREYLGGTAEFSKLILSDRRTIPGMLRAFTATIGGRVSHVLLNEKQEKNIPNASTIVSFAPGFQLDAQPYRKMIAGFNDLGIPVFTSPSLPQGFQAFTYNQHPYFLVDALLEFTNQLAHARPNTRIIALGHSYGAAQQAHTWSMLNSDIQARVTPVTYQGMLRGVGKMACALPHSPLYPIPRDIFRGKDPFLSLAYEILSDNPSSLFGFDSNDGYMDQERQLGDIPSTDNRVITLDDQRSPGHYGDSFLFARDFARRILEKIGTKPQ